MAKVDVSTRTIQSGNFDFHYCADDFVNAESYDARDHRRNRVWIIHTCGTVLAIVFAKYYAYCDRDALNEAANSGKLDSLQVSDEELKDYEIGKDSEGYPEYEGIINLGDASEPFDSQNLEYFTVPANIFHLDPVIMAVIEEQSRNEACEALQDAANASIHADSLDVEDYRMLRNAADYLRQTA